MKRLCALLGPRQKALGADQLVNGSAALRTRTEEDLKVVIAEFADGQTQPSAPVPAPMLDVEPAEPTPKKKRLSRLEERREARVRAAAGGGGDSSSAQPQTRADRARGVGVLGGAGPSLRGCLQPSGVLESAGHRQRIPDDEYGRVSSVDHAVSGVYHSVVPWDRGHQLSARASFFGARLPHWLPAQEHACN